MLVRLLPWSSAELANNVPVLALAPQHVLVDDQPFQPHGTPRVYPTSADTDLSAKTVSEPVREAGARVDERPCRVDASAECRRRGLVLRDDGLGVM